MPTKNEESKPVIRYLVAGSLTRSTIVTASGNILVDQPGGGALYSAGGVGLWDTNVGILGKISADFPLEWLDAAARHGFDITWGKEIQ